MASSPNPDNFVFVPETLADEIGAATHQGARLELAVLSAMLFYWGKNKDTEASYTASGGVLIQTGRDEFVLSANRIATNLWFRWFTKLPDDPDYHNFFERVRASLKRLKQNNYVRFIRTATGSRNYRYGSVWSFRGTRLDDVADEAMPRCRAAGFVFGSDTRVRARDGYANAVDLVGSKIISERHTAYRYGEVVANLFERGMFYDYKQWAKLVAAKGVKGSRHTTCGAFRNADLKEIEEASTYMIYANFDSDHDNFFDNYEEACHIAKYFISEGVSPRDIICSKTGGRGCHVQIPGGAFGNPVFRRSWSQKNTLKFFAKIKMDVKTDHGLFDPAHLIRMIGSQHEKTGHYKQAYTADEFIATHPYTLMQSTEFKPFALNDPSDAPVCPNLVEGLVDCSEADHEFDMVEYSEVETMEEGNWGISTTVRAALEKGVAEGENWGNYVGRDMRMYVLSSHFYALHAGNEELVYRDLQAENLRNSPPLPEYVIRRKIAARSRDAGHSRGSRNTYSR